MVSSNQIERMAAAWLARRDAGDWAACDQMQLDAWLQESTAHRVAYLRLAAGWRQSARLKAVGAGIPEGTLPQRGAWGFPVSHEARDMWADYRSDGRSSGASPRPGTTPSRPGGRISRYITVAVLIAAISSLALGWQHYTAVDRASYSTVIGGLRDVQLPDGSVVTLNSDSQVMVTLSNRERRIDLQRGEAFFKVAKDASRPFVVSAGDRRAIAVGTRYDVRRDADQLRVVVTQGVVRLESDNTPSGGTQPTATLPAGSIALASAAGVMVRSGSIQQAEDLLNWRDGFITFHNTPLGAAVAEFNRYNQRQIVIGDASIANLRVGGNFRWSNADSFVRLLELGFPVRAERGKDAIVLRRR